jgi:pyruvate dehydrogenase E2 component (dihydrolipoamide acetyltransferase)
MTDVAMPQMGESIVEGTLTRWLKKPGDRVERDEPLFEISTDKVDSEIPSPTAGTLSDLLVLEGQTVQVNAIVARIDEGRNGADAAPAKTGASDAPAMNEAPVVAKASVASKTSTAPMTPVSIRLTGAVSPLALRLARENKTDLSAIAGTGLGGRITKTDVEARIPHPAAPMPVAPLPAVRMALADRIEPMTSMRSRIAEHMLMSQTVSAHVTTVHRVDMTRIAKVRAQHKQDFASRYGISLTFLPFIARAAVHALNAFPVFNASLDRNNIVYHGDINVGIAVALDNGLIVPVIRLADEKNVLGLQKAIVDLSSRARSRQLNPDEIQGGTFSITNFGSFGSVFATPIINQPQVAILGVGAVEKVPVVVNDAIAIRSQCYLALTFDHRLIDGALADRFTAVVKAMLENWSEEIL